MVQFDTEYRMVQFGTVVQFDTEYRMVQNGTVGYTVWYDGTV